MSANRLTIEGLDELLSALRRLPQDLADDGAGVVAATTNEAARSIVDGYPTVSGNLKDGVTAQVQRSGFGVIGTVRSRAKHAQIFEVGTASRQTALGYNRGAMPPGNVFVPVMIRRRKRMYELLKAIVAKQGLEVSGDA